ncbi:MAG: hypothetical protein WC882_02640 [Candidatus Gracilibacteria bacterium]
MRTRASRDVAGHEEEFLEALADAPDQNPETVIKVTRRVRSRTNHGKMENRTDKYKIL